MTCSLLLVSCLELGSTAVAASAGIEPLPSQHDGVYGRFDADLDAGFGLGAALSEAAPSLAVRGTMHYFSTAGLYVAAEVPTADETASTSILSFGVDLRPAFLPRFSENLEQGPAWFDLAIDSISLSLGPYFGLDRGGMGLEASVGAGVPLFGEVSGLWIEARGVGRFPDVDEDASFNGLVLISWHAGFASPWLAAAR